MSLVAAFRGLRDDLDLPRKGFAFAGIMGIFIMLIHATTDFSLHIPANVATFMIILALPWIVTKAKTGGVGN